MSGTESSIGIRITTKLFEDRGELMLCGLEVVECEADAAVDDTAVDVVWTSTCGGVGRCQSLTNSALQQQRLRQTELKMLLITVPSTPSTLEDGGRLDGCLMQWTWIVPTELAGFDLGQRIFRLMHEAVHLATLGVGPESIEQSDSRTPCLAGAGILLPESRSEHPFWVC